MNSSTKRKKTKERDNKNNDCNQTWLQKAKQHNILQFLQALENGKTERTQLGIPLG